MCSTSALTSVAASQPLESVEQVLLGIDGGRRADIATTGVRFVIVDLKFHLARMVSNSVEATCRQAVLTTARGAVDNEIALGTFP